MREEVLAMLSTQRSPQNPVVWTGSFYRSGATHSPPASAGRASASGLHLWSGPGGRPPFSCCSSQHPSRTPASWKGPWMLDEHYARLPDSAAMKTGGAAHRSLRHWLHPHLSHLVLWELPTSRTGWVWAWTNRLVRFSVSTTQKWDRDLKNKLISKKWGEEPQIHIHKAAYADFCKEAHSCLFVFGAKIQADWGEMHSVNGYLLGKGGMGEQGSPRTSFSVTLILEPLECLKIPKTLTKKCKKAAENEMPQS